MIFLSDGTIPAVLSVAGLAGFLVYHFWSMRKRARDMRAFATQSGFNFLGTAVLGSIRLAKTSLHSISETWNSMEGDRHGLQVAIFDCRIGTGKQSHVCTVLAAHTTKDVFATLPAYHRSLSVEPAGEWMILFEPFSSSKLSRLMPIPEIAAHINALEQP